MLRTKVLVLTGLFPNPIQPGHGIFLKHRLTQMASAHDLGLRVVAPAPWFPFTHDLFGRFGRLARVPSESNADGLQVVHPRYPTLPGAGKLPSPLLVAVSAFKAARRLQQGGFDFDIIDAYYLYPYGVAAVMLGQWLDKPVIITGLGSDISLIPNQRAPRALVQWALSKADAVTVVCQALKDEAVRLGAAESLVRVVAHGVDLNLFRPSSNRDSLRLCHGITGPTLISVGHLDDNKGHHLAIEALVRLPGVRLLVAGDGPNDAELRMLARANGLEERVSFLGRVDQLKLSELLCAADLLVSCSEREGIANVLLEALACGTPVAATPVWGSPEVVTTPEAGILFTERSVDAIASGVRRLLSALPDRHATRGFAEHHYSWRRTSDDHHAAIEHILGNRRHRPEGELGLPALAAAGDYA